ncbi:MAG TPA: ABC transporter ATP-binding protein [Anaerolineales bacterium]|nr:ABC transporter ATP-binding protein [Anaerolineales bacterium]
MRNSRTTDRRPQLDKKALGRAIRYLGHYRSLAILPYLFLVIATAAQLMVPRMVRNIIDAVTQGMIANTLIPRLGSIPDTVQSRIFTALSITKEQLFYNSENAERLLINAGIAILIFAIVRGLFAFLQTFTAERNSQSVAFDLRNELFAKIQNLSFSYHDRTQTGQLMVRATDDVEKVRLFIGQGLLMAVGALILLSGTLIILFTTNLRLTLVALPILPLALIMFLVFGAVSGPLFVKVQARLDRLNTTLQENLAGIKVVKAFTREKSEQMKFDQAADSLMRQQITVSRLFSFLFPLIILVASVGQTIVLYYGGRQIFSGTLTLGEWQEFSLYLVYIFFPMALLGMIITQMSQASASAGRIFEILDAEVEVKDKPGAIALPSVEGHVVFENVTFRYFGSGEPVLKNIDFQVKAGQTVALLGATGSGKTTIINLLPRFYDPSQGRITFDGNDIRDVTLESLRSQIGIVLQESTLFAGTIAENIAFGRPDATLEEIQVMAKAAAAHEFILSFPDGYETPVGERGATLSGGQKQRIAIARALLLNPRILILDDSTSSVDLTTEAQIQKALDKLMKGRTSFVIAQRISTVMNADLILVLEKGQIVAQGQHEDLLESSELYTEIYTSQLIGDVVVEAEAELELAG